MARYPSTVWQIKPDAVPEAKWLAVPEQLFNMILRIYGGAEGSDFTGTTYFPLLLTGRLGSS